MTLPVPTEFVEHSQVVQYLRLKNIPHFHIPNSTWTKSFKQRATNAALGVSRGAPDLMCIVNNQLLAIEMKRVKGGVVAPEQREWLARLEAAGVPGKICRGAQEAIDFIQYYER